MKKSPDIHRLLEFQKLLLQFQGIQRQIHLPPGTVDTENDVEHSYGVAMIGWYLAEYFPDLDRDRIIKLGLAHDLLETHAGDTYSYGSTVGKQERERLAVDKLKTDWQDFPDILSAIDEYEARQTEEAKFVYAIDKLAPAMIEYLNEGVGWRNMKITAQMFRTEKDRKISVSPEISNYMNQLHDVLSTQLHLFAPEETTDKA